MKRILIPCQFFTAGILLLDPTRSPAQSVTQSNAPVRLQEMTVMGTNLLNEEMPIDDYGQPVWTARRRFVTTRVYVQPPWQAELELGYDGTYPRMGQAQRLVQEEFELGLPHRFQFDVENVNQDFVEDDDSPGRRWHHVSNSLELRYALADWGVIPLNPTVNVEWRFDDQAADAFECQLLLGEDLAPRWHWGLNLFYERQIGDDLIRELAASQALSYTLIDEKLSAGVEMKFSSESDKDSRNHPEDTFSIGPSFQWRPTSRTHLDVVPLCGVTGDAPNVELFVFFGIEFGPGSKERETVMPASLRGK